MNIGKSFLIAGNDPALFPSANTRCSAEIYDTGFFNVVQPCEGQHVSIRLETIDYSSNGKWYSIAELRLYQVPNLLIELEKSVSISAPEPSSS